MPTPPFSWTCPYCNQKTTVNNDDFLTRNLQMQSAAKSGKRWFEIYYIICPNPECKEFSLYAEVCEWSPRKYGNSKGSLLLETRIVPSTFSIKFPDYIPEAIRADYREACDILELSPKASATLSRRCLQGMIRDFWGVTKRNLYQEINAIQEMIDPLTWQAIDAVRKIGNIGAHMEKDVNLIVDIEPEEAGQLIRLVEMLLKDWYITRHEREQNLNSIIDTGKKKEEEQKT